MGWRGNNDSGYNGGYEGIMIRKIALAVLLFCLMLPATAAPACHVGAPVASTSTETMTHHHVSDTDDDGNPDTDHRHQPGEQQHLCIGCIAFAPTIAMASMVPQLPAMVSPSRIAELGAFRASPRLRPPQA